MALRIVRDPEAFSLSTDAKKRPREHRKDHLRFISELYCLVTGQPNPDACHVRYGSIFHGKRQVGMAEKPSDRWTVPLCRAEHTRQHSMDEEAYWRAVNIDPLTVAALLWSASGDTEAALQIIAAARAGQFPWRTP